MAENIRGGKQIQKGERGDGRCYCPCNNCCLRRTYRVLIATATQHCRKYGHIDGGSNDYRPVTELPPNFLQRLSPLQNQLPQLNSSRIDDVEPQENIATKKMDQCMMRKAEEGKEQTVSFFQQVGDKAKGATQGFMDAVKSPFGGEQNK